MNTYIDIINLWDDCEVLARDISKSGATVRTWKSRDTIPSYAWLSIERSARLRGYKQVTLKLLAELAEKKNHL